MKLFKMNIDDLNPIINTNISYLQLLNEFSDIRENIHDINRINSEIEYYYLHKIVIDNYVESLEKVLYNSDNISDDTIELINITLEKVIAPIPDLFITKNVTTITKNDNITKTTNLLLDALKNASISIGKKIWESVIILSDKLVIATTKMVNYNKGFHKHMNILLKNIDNNGLIDDNYIIKPWIPIFFNIKEVRVLTIDEVSDITDKTLKLYDVATNILHISETHIKELNTSIPNINEAKLKTILNIYYKDILRQLEIIGNTNLYAGFNQPVLTNDINDYSFSFKFKKIEPKYTIPKTVSVIKPDEDSLRSLIRSCMSYLDHNEYIRQYTSSINKDIGILIKSIINYKHTDNITNDIKDLLTTFSNVSKLSFEVVTRILSICTTTSNNVLRYTETFVN